MNCCIPRFEPHVSQYSTTSFLHGSTNAADGPPLESGAMSERRRTGIIPCWRVGWCVNELWGVGVLKSE